MSNSSAKYCQHVKDRLYKKIMKYMKVFLKKKKKINNIIVEDTTISQRMKSKSWLSIEKNIMK